MRYLLSVFKLSNSVYIYFYWQWLAWKIKSLCIDKVSISSCSLFDQHLREFLFERILYQVTWDKEGDSWDLLICICTVQLIALSIWGLPMCWHVLQVPADWMIPFNFWYLGFFFFHSVVGAIGFHYVITFQILFSLPASFHFSLT